MAVQLQDQNGNIIKTFVTQTDCAKSLGVTRTTVARWLQEGKPVLFDNKLVYIAKVEVLEEEGG
jgi:DNA invertase Pin-like site-specific DNA recombinase